MWNYSKIVSPEWKNYKQIDSIGTIPIGGHAFIRVTLCKKHVFYLDRGNWGHIFDDSKIGWPETISSQIPQWGLLR